MSLIQLRSLSDWTRRGEAFVASLECRDTIGQIETIKLYANNRVPPEPFAGYNFTKLAHIHDIIVFVSLSTEKLVKMFSSDKLLPAAMSVQYQLHLS